MSLEYTREIELTGLTDGYEVANEEKRNQR